MNKFIIIAIVIIVFYKPLFIVGVVVGYVMHRYRTEQKKNDTSVDEKFIDSIFRLISKTNKIDNRWYSVIREYWSDLSDNGENPYFPALELAIDYSNLVEKYWTKEHIEEYTKDIKINDKYNNDINNKFVFVLFKNIIKTNFTLTKVVEDNYENYINNLFVKFNISKLLKKLSDETDYDVYFTSTFVINFYGRILGTYFKKIKKLDIYKKDLLPIRLTELFRYCGDKCTDMIYDYIKHKPQTPIEYINKSWYLLDAFPEEILNTL